MSSAWRLFVQRLVRAVMGCGDGVFPRGTIRLSSAALRKKVPGSSDHRCFPVPRRLVDAAVAAHASQIE